MYVLVEMWPPSRSIVTSRKFFDVVEIFQVKIMFLCCLLMLLIKSNILHYFVYNIDNHHRSIIFTSNI